MEINLVSLGVDYKSTCEKYALTDYDSHLKAILADVRIHKIDWNNREAFNYIRTICNQFCVKLTACKSRLKKSNHDILNKYFKSGQCKRNFDKSK